jgi:hypothetical protein
MVNMQEEYNKVTWFTPSNQGTPSFPLLGAQKEQRSFVKLKEHNLGSLLLAEPENHSRKMKTSTITYQKL